MARNAKSRKLRNKKMRGGGVTPPTESLLCRTFGFGCNKKVAPSNNTSESQFQGARDSTLQGDGSSEAMTPEQMEEMRKNAANTLKAKGVYADGSGKFRGGKSNRRRNKKSKKSRRTRRR